MLDAYLTQTRQLLQNPAAPNPLYSAADLTSYINRARGQLAGESESIRAIGTLALVAGQRVYDFSSITVPNAATRGIAGVFKVRMSSYALGSGQRLMTVRGWEWFNTYKMNTPVPQEGQPEEWAQYGQGTTGSIYVDPLPDQAYTLSLDCVCTPEDLADDNDPEAIPFPWTDAVCFFAAYYALLSSQNAARQNDADRMMSRYSEFTNRARRYSNPDLQRYVWSQSGDPTTPAKLGQGGPR